jgi:hypothetical protein
VALKCYWNEKDAIFFTGDLVNNEARSEQDYIDVFSNEAAHEKRTKTPDNFFVTV